MIFWAVCVAGCVAAAYYGVRKSMKGSHHIILANADTPLGTHILACCNTIKQRIFKVCPWCSGPLANTLVNHLRPSRKVRFERRYFETEDGGRLGLDWLAPGLSSPVNCTVVFFPGFASTSASGYIARAARAVQARMEANGVACSVAVCVFRGMHGNELQNVRYHNLADSSDALECVRHAVACSAKNARLILVGYSLGANLMTKLLGESHAVLEPAVRGAVAVGSAYNMVGVATSHTRPRLSLVHRFMKWHSARVTRAVARKHRHLAEAYNRHPATPAARRVDIEKAMQCRQAQDFTDAYSCRVYGIPTVDEYYTLASAKRVIREVKVPLVLCSAADDPIVTPNGFVDDMVEDCKHNPNLFLVATRRGGHLGWAHGWNAGDWMTEFVAEAVLALWTRQ